jgi:hypothetical protein
MTLRSIYNDVLIDWAKLDNLPTNTNTSIAWKVSLTWDETIAWIKTFSSVPVLPASDPTTSNQSTRKSYVDTFKPDFFKYQIIPAVVSNNLTVTLKNYNWDIPTAIAPIKYQDWSWTIRTISSALSWNINAWTNWFNAWSSELATKEIDFFSYLLYDSVSSTTALIISRIPYATINSDFSSTSTNEKYSAWIWTYNRTAWDRCVNIWKFSAILSAWAWYTWTIWAWTTINQYINETNWLSWSPVLTGWSVLSWFTTAYYKVVWNTVQCFVCADNKTLTWAWIINISQPWGIASWFGTTPTQYVANDWTNWVVPHSNSTQFFKTAWAWTWAWWETWVYIRFSNNYKIA